MKFLKNFGLGLVTIVLLPFFLLVLALFAVYLLIVYCIELIHNLIRFFKGEKGLPKLPEDLKVDAIKKKNLQITIENESPKEETKIPQAPPSPTHVYIQQNYYQKDQKLSQNESLEQSSLNGNYQNNTANAQLNAKITPQNFIDMNSFENKEEPSYIEDASKIDGGHNQ